MDDTISNVSGKGDYTNIYGLGGNDNLTGYNTTDKLYGGDGDDILNLYGYYNTAYGEDGDDIFNSFANSCNTSFINMGLTLDYKMYKATAEELLFNKELPYDSEYSKSQFNLSEDSSRFDIAQTAFGQGQTLVTPLHLAMITSAIANDGVLNKPYMMERVESCDGLVVKEFKTDSTKLMTEDEAKFLQKGMKQVIEQSYKWAFEDADYSVSGKSGTAQFGTQGYEHSLFVSYSPSEKPEIAVTVIVEGSENRTVHAAKATRAIYDYYYKNK